MRAALGFCLCIKHTILSLPRYCKQEQPCVQVATKGYSKVLTDSALQVDFFIHHHFFLINAKTKVLSRPKPSVNMQRIHSGNTDGVNTSEIKIVSLRDLAKTEPSSGWPSIGGISTFMLGLMSPISLFSTVCSRHCCCVLVS